MSLFRQRILKLGQGRVRLFGQKRQDRLGLSLDRRRATISAHRLGTQIATGFGLSDPADGARNPDTKMRRSAAARHPAFDCRNDPFAKIQGKRFSHPRRPPSPVKRMNQISPDS
jgi:hypothetical protein